MNIKRNLICYRKQDAEAGIIVYGRVVKQVRPGYWLVVDCGRFATVLHEDNIILEPDYTGFEHCDRFYRMPSLRKIKQMVAHYDKTIWARHPDHLKESVDGP